MPCEWAGPRSPSSLGATSTARTHRRRNRNKENCHQTLTALTFQAANSLPATTILLALQRTLHCCQPLLVHVCSLLRSASPALTCPARLLVGVGKRAQFLPRMCVCVCTCRPPFVHCHLHLAPAVAVSWLLPCCCFVTGAFMCAPRHKGCMLPSYPPVVHSFCHFVAHIIRFTTLFCLSCDPPSCCSCCGFFHPPRTLRGTPPLCNTFLRPKPQHNVGATVGARRNRDSLTGLRSWRGGMWKAAAAS